MSTNMAAMSMAAQASGMSMPSMPSMGSPSGGNAENDPEGAGEGEEGEGGGGGGKMTLMTTAVIGGAAASVGFNVLGIVAGGILSLVAGVVAVAVAPTVAARQFQLDDTGSLRNIQNMLRSEVNRLSGENDVLHDNITDLEDQVARVKQFEENLGSIVEQQGASVDKFVGLIAENRELLRKMKEIVRTQTLQQILSVVISSDRDSSSTFDDREIRILTTRLRNIPGLNLNEERFIKVIRKTDHSLAQIMTKVRELIHEEVPDEKRIIRLDLDHLRDRYKDQI